MYEWNQRRLSGIICHHCLQTLFYGSDSLVSQVWFSDASGVRLVLKLYNPEENETLSVLSINVVSYEHR